MEMTINVHVSDEEIHQYEDIRYNTTLSELLPDAEKVYNLHGKEIPLTMKMRGTMDVYLFKD